MSEEEEELDDETIQARVDASLAKIYEVTSTWLKPKKTPSAPKRDFEKEIEELMRRPPRLGVGAELPEKRVKSGPSELKLKNKMLGKKREREETNVNDAAVDPTPEDDEEESKSRVIQKKPRLDPFASGKKKGKGLSAQTTVPPHKPAGTPPDFETKPEEVITASTKDEDAPGASSSKNTLDMASTSKSTLDADGLDDEEEGKEPVVKSVATNPKPTPDLPPILNLYCPPTMRNDPEPSPKKKRKKKKKKHHVGGDAGAASRTPAG